MGYSVRELLLLLLYFFLLKPSIAEDHLQLGTPSTAWSIVRHKAYALGYSEEMEQAVWVSYHLTADQLLGGSVSRSDDFREDPLVLTGSAALQDYKRSGYDRGHLAPAADMAWNSTVMSESFFLSNMSPQLPGFNRGIWKSLEEWVRSQAVVCGALWVVTGPVPEPGLPEIGASGVDVPRLYYKVLLDLEEPDTKAIGFILPNQKSSQPLAFYAVSVDNVEALTGLDFFSNLPDDQEKDLEAAFDFSSWSGAPVTSPRKIEPDSQPATTQCQALTKSGKRCKRKASKGNYCWQHAK